MRTQGQTASIFRFTLKSKSSLAYLTSWWPCVSFFSTFCLCLRYRRTYQYGGIWHPGMKTGKECGTNVVVDIKFNDNIGTLIFRTVILQNKEQHGSFDPELREIQAGTTYADKHTCRVVQAFKIPTRLQLKRWAMCCRGDICIICLHLAHLLPKINHIFTV